MLRPALLFAVLPMLCSAATYTVKAAGGGNYTTIQACATAMGNGDTCTVYAGTYDEHVTVPAGDVAAYKTLQVNGTDAVYVYDFVLNSHTKVIGFRIQNPSSPYGKDCVAIANNATDVYITGNALYACGNHAMISGVNATDVFSYVSIQNNTFSYSCSTSSAPNTCKAITVAGDHILVENNDISHVSDGMSVQGSYHVIRGNTFQDVTDTECGSHSGNCHIDFIESEPSSATGHNVYEGNTLLNNTGQHGHGYLTQADGCSGQCSHVILRFNVGAHVGSGALIDDNAGATGVAGFSAVKSYNNTWVDFVNYAGNAPYGRALNFANNSTYGAVVNDLFYFPAAMMDFNPYSVDASSLTGFTSRNNLAYCSAAPCNLHARAYGSGAFADDAGNVTSDPKFISYAGGDYRPGTGSPAINGGSYLTTVAVADSGSGTSLVVNDSRFFQDGYGIAQADWIAVGSVTNTVQISSINYSTHTITLASAVARNDNDPVYLYKNSTGRQVLYGTAPDIGAYEYTGVGVSITGGSHSGSRQ